MSTPLRDVLALVRPRIGLLAAAGAGAGFLAAGRGPGSGLMAAAAGAFLLSCGASALNQVQERAEDARMKRTKNRPLPAGRMTVKAAWALALVCLALSALALAASTGGLAAALFAPLTFLVYNGLYTPLKKRTSLAMLVGGLAGAFPPLVGFAAAGASPLGPNALLLAGVFYAWQVPHFWLFARMHRAEYEAAGFHVPQHGVAQSRAGGTLALWLVGYGALMLLIPAFGLVAQPVWQGLVAALAAALSLGAWPLMARERLGFALVNASLLLFLCFLAADALDILGLAA
ncbi:MAG: UbiA family prenyltransferase [Humidesulfovibrio sp.]|uniref:UbiA family prenyltransferase n=1 Tax=Humidesulfovibrio sp. TaxID=2910988 RepID=UPI0027329C00|nr:UbiA family prenyltransferase [Humidesulfovibrio sp.]MDP2847487.1 UbiA family prenyltransferase [Humidesulfovibrio sp.]